MQESLLPTPTSASSQQELLSSLADSGMLDTIFQWAIRVGVFFWIVGIIRVLKDSTARSRNLLFQIVSILLVTFLTPILWIPLYVAIRPVRYAFDKQKRRESADLQTVQCQKCHKTNLGEFDHCIYCGTGIRITCKECKTVYPNDFPYCNTCGAPNLKQ